MNTTDARRDTPGGLTPQTVFDGTCPSCQRSCTHEPLKQHGRSRAYAPALDIMNVTCSGCGARVTLHARSAPVLGEFEDHDQLKDRLVENGVDEENEALTWAPIS
jgi:hypothetical protein